MASYFRPILVFTGILTLVQSIAWFVLSLLGILAYRCQLSVPEQDGFTRLLNHLYFEGPNCPTTVSIPGQPDIRISEQVYADPLYINAWMGSYLALNITYFLIAICMFIGRCRSSDGSAYSVSTIRLWCINTFAFLIMDLWLTIIWGIDFGKLSDYVTKYNLENSFSWAPSVPGALMAITARGFFLYLINLALFCYMVRFTFDWKNIYYCCQMSASGSQQQLHQPSTYPHQSIPRVDQHWVDNGKSLVPVSQVYPSYGRPPLFAQEGVTSFNEWNGEPHSTRQQKPVIWDDERPGKPRAPTPPKPKIREDVHAAGHPHKSNIEFQDRRNFEQGGNRPLHQGVRGRSNDAFY